MIKSKVENLSELPKVILDSDFTHEYLKTLKNFTYKGIQGVFKVHRYDFNSFRGFEGNYNFYCEGAWFGKRDIFIDNFPAQNKYYESTIPLLTVADFHRECEILGIKIEI